MFQRHVIQELSAFCHDELTAEDSRRVAQHLQSCERCRTEYEEIKLGVDFAAHLLPIPAPPSLWSEIETLWEKQSSHQSPLQLEHRLFAPGIRWHRPAAAGALLFLVLAIVAAWYSRSSLFHEGKKPAQVDLDHYLTGIEHSPPEGSYAAISSAAPGFESAEPLKALKAAGIERVSSVPPLPGYDLLHYRLQMAKRQDVVQLVYGKGKEEFSVFVAPKSVEFLLGHRQITHIKLGEISCDKVDCPRTSTLAFGAGGFHCVLVSKMTDMNEIGTVIRYFVSAHKSATS